MAASTEQEPPDGRDRPPLSHRLSVRLFALTALAVIFAEVTLFVPAIANFRQNWLSSKLEAVSFATLISGFGESGAPLSPDQQAAVLAMLDAELVALHDPDAKRLVARTSDIGTVDVTVDLGEEGIFTAMGESVDTLVRGGNRLMRVVGPVGEGGMRAEIVIREAPLRRAMLERGGQVFLVSLTIAGFAGLLVFTAIHVLLLAPIRRIAENMVRFRDDPENGDLVIRPGARRDELGLATGELARMQSALARTLRERRHLADLGLAVSKINHDLRNILASAQLISDRLSSLPDAGVQRLAPVLVRSLDRALAYTQSVLTYGQAVESPPARRWVRLHLLVQEILDAQPLSPEAAIDLINLVPADLEVEVDPEQFFRVLSNLVRNGVQALDASDGEAAVLRRVTVSAGRRENASLVWMAVEDTGPGVGAVARENLFQAFRGSTRPGGSGLGLAIAQEIVQAHNGRIELVAGTLSGARFEIELPQRAPSPEK